jgi:O-methyltransferase
VQPNPVLTTIVAPSQLMYMRELALTAPPGAIAEIGVFRGGSAYVLYGVALQQGRELHLFDTFTGTPVARACDKHKVDGEFAAPETPDNIRKLLPAAHLHIGMYPQTHPEDLRDVAFVHCDCDQYDSYVAVINYMWPIMVPGGILLFDDYPYLEGAKLAVEEYFPQEALRLCGQRYYVVK